MSTPTRQWFQPGEGIAREVITADIQRYLGPDALVRPGEGTGEYEGVQGYWITAYRTLTSQMVQDLRLDSQRWRAEVQQTQVTYQNSRTHQSRQYYGPTTPAPAQNPTDYAQPQQQQQQQQPPRAAFASQPTHQSYTAESAYTYQPAQPGYGQPQGYTPAYDQGQGQNRTAAYTYGQPGQEGHYPSNAQPGYYQPRQQAAAPPRDQVYQTPQQSNPPTGYYTAADGRTYTADGRTYTAADGRTYTANPPPQANDSRRRR